MREISIIWRNFSDLSPHELYALLKLRSKVFVVEQQCLYLDLDDRDESARHLLVNSEQAVGAYLRLRSSSESPAAVKIERVVVSPELRGRGLARYMIVEALAEADRSFGEVAIEISAQSHLEQFYQTLGFKRVSCDYLEYGISHCDMLLRT